MIGFVGIRPQALNELASHYDLSAFERWLLVALCLHADHRTGQWVGTQIDLAAIIGIAARNLRPHLATLTERGLIDAKWPRGHQGTVQVLAYCDIVHLPPSQRTIHPLRPEARNGSTTRESLLTDHR